MGAQKIADLKRNVGAVCSPYLGSLSQEVADRFNKREKDSLEIQHAVLKAPCLICR